MKDLSQNTINYCKRLRLGAPFVDAVQGKKTKEQEYLVSLMESEIERRDAVAIEKRIKAANFPAIKLLKDFIPDDVSFPKSVTFDYFSECEFIKDRNNIFCYGEPGTGKTHLAIAIGIEACNLKHHVLFFRMVDLVERLKAASLSKDKKFFKAISKADLIIIDEFGFPPSDDDFIPILFEFVSVYCYEKKSLILTSNNTISDWLSVFVGTRDEKMSQAVIDRIVQDSFLFDFHGESHRVLNSKMRD